MNEKLSSYRARIDNALKQVLPPENDADTQLQAAMHYATTNGGKRIRPILVYATGNALGAPLALLDIPACAIELMHAYSLVHDDLPAMDDDDLRRGLPTCHRRFDEATAILAGDALQALAFTILADNANAAIDAESRINMIRTLGQASGANGMAAGQAVDLAAVGQRLSLDELEHMHSLKTGALIRASVRLAVQTANAGEHLCRQLDRYANAVGLAFQIVDDILDVTSDTKTLGKTQGADQALNKPTFPSLLGLDGARQRAAAMHDEALTSIREFGPDFDELREISTLIVERSY